MNANLKIPLHARPRRDSTLRRRKVGILAASLTTLGILANTINPFQTHIPAAYPENFASVTETTPTRNSGNEVMESLINETYDRDFFLPQLVDDLREIDHRIEEIRPESADARWLGRYFPDPPRIHLLMTASQIREPPREMYRKVLGHEGFGHHNYAHVLSASLRDEFNALVYDWIRGVKAATEEIQGRGLKRSEVKPELLYKHGITLRIYDSVSVILAREDDYKARYRSEYRRKTLGQELPLEEEIMQENEAQMEAYADNQVILRFNTTEMYAYLLVQALGKYLENPENRSSREISFPDIPPELLPFIAPVLNPDVRITAPSPSVITNINTLNYVLRARSLIVEPFVGPLQQQ